MRDVQGKTVLDVLQIVGALGILIPYMLTLFGSLSVSTYPYLISNMIGAGLLAVLALIGRDWGFLLLEGTWALVALYTLLRLSRSARPA